MAQCFSLVLIFLRVYPSKGLVTQQPDERPQITCLLMGMAQRWQSQRRETHRENQETGFAFQLADFEQVTSCRLMPVSQKYSEEALPQFSSFSNLLSLRAKALCLLPLMSRLWPTQWQQGWSPSPQQGDKSRQKGVNRRGLCSSGNQITVFLKMRSLPSRTFVKCFKFPWWSLRSPGVCRNHLTCDKSCLQGCLRTSGNRRLGWGTACCPHGISPIKEFPWASGGSWSYLLERMSLSWEA